MITHFPNHSLFVESHSSALKPSRLPTTYSLHTFYFSNQDPIFLSVLISQIIRAHIIQWLSLATGPLSCLYSVCPLCLECHLPIFQCPNAPCLLEVHSSMPLSQEAFPDLRSEYHFRAHLHPVQPSGKVLTTLHHNDGGSIGRDQLSYPENCSSASPLLSEAD